jgi:DNA-binding NarL/FixJ family response regulator
VNTLCAAHRPPLPHSISEQLSELAYNLTVIYGLRLRLVTPYGHELPIHATARPAGNSPLDQLTASEFRVARLVARGASNREVADWLSVSAKTVWSRI